MRRVGIKKLKLVLMGLCCLSLPAYGFFTVHAAPKCRASKTLVKTVKGVLAPQDKAVLDGRYRNACIYTGNPMKIDQENENVYIECACND